jgi:hypothetical protein
MRTLRPLVQFIVVGPLLVTHAASFVHAQSEERTSFDDQFDRWIDELADSKPEVRRRAYDKLRQIPDWRMTLPRSLRMLRAATRTFPPLAIDGAEKPDPFCEPPIGDTSALLVHFVASRPRSEYIGSLIECFGKYSPQARSQAMELLATLEDREAAEATMKLVRQYATKGGIPELHLWGWSESPDCASVFFPDLLAYADEPGYEEEILGLLHSYAQMPESPLDLMERCATHVLERYRLHKAKLLPLLRAGAIERIYTKDYAAHRGPACQLLSLLGQCLTDDAREELHQAVGFRDPLLKLSAAVELLRLGDAVPATIWHDIATSAETRISLFDELAKRDRLQLFPQKHLTQAALAESDLVRWLVNDSEARRPPAKVELVKVVSIDPQTEDGLLDYYVFQFCMEPPTADKPPEWKAGVAGPYPRTEQPTATAHDTPHSAFEPIDDKWPEEHIGDVSEIIQEYRWRAGIGE